MSGCFLISRLGTYVPAAPISYRTGAISPVSASTGGSLTIPATTAVGDLLVFVSSGRYNSPIPPALPSGGWTDHGLTSSGGTSYLRIYSKVAAAGDAGQVMSFPSGAQWSIVSVSVYQSAGATSYSVSPTTLGGSGATITAPVVTVPTDGLVLEAWAAADTLSGGSITPPVAAVLYQTYTHNTLATTHRTTGAARTASTNHPFNVGASIVLEALP